jgi:hypothetical protein
MTNILVFRRRPAEERQRRADGPAAQIVIFPGIRYERLETPVEAKRSKPKRTLRRQG